VRNRLAPFSGVVPVFPLPETVFFPGALLPLHVFEPRYRAMVEDAVRGENLIAVATLLPGWESFAGDAPPWHPLATVGRLVRVEELDDGRKNIVLRGLERARLEEEAGDLPYRRARATALPEPEFEEDAALAELKHRLLLTSAYLLQVRSNAEARGSVFAWEEMSFEGAVHTLCQNLDVPVLSKLRALEAPDARARALMVRGWVREKLDQALTGRGLPALSGDGRERN
jgi:Lon protease-like protein